MNSNNTILSIFDFSNNVFFSSISLFTSAEFFTILFIFNFMQLLILTVISELIWPTQIFNKQHNIGYKVYRLRTYTETLSKLKNYTNFYKIFFLTITKFK